MPGSDARSYRAGRNTSGRSRGSPWKNRYAITVALVVVAGVILVVIFLGNGGNNQSGVHKPKNQAKAKPTVVRKAPPAKQVTTTPAHATKTKQVEPKIKKYKLTWQTKGPGTMLVVEQSTGRKLNPGPQKAGTKVELTAKPNSNAWFVGWGGACTKYKAQNRCVLKMDGLKGVNARFKLVPVKVIPAAPTSGSPTQVAPVATQPPKTNQAPTVETTKPGTRKLIPPPIAVAPPSVLTPPKTTT